MISVLHCIGKPVKGGLERIVVNITRQNTPINKNFNFYILSFGGSKKNKHQFYKNIFIDFYLKYNFINLLFFLNKKKINIVHCHTLKPLIIFIFLKPFYKYKLIYHIHTYKIFDYWFFPFITFLLKRAESILVVNDDLREILNNRCNLSSIVIYNGINDKSIITLSKIHSSKSDVISIGYVGRLESEKFILELGKIICSLNIDVNLIKLNIFGSGKLRNILENDLTSKSLNYEIFENEDDLEKIYKNFDILVVPSKLETFSLVTLEALIANKIVLTRDKISYNIFKPYFSENICLVSNTLIINKKVRNYNLDNILQTFSLTNQIEKLIKLYELLLKAHV